MFPVRAQNLAHYPWIPAASIILDIVIIALIILDLTIEVIISLKLYLKSRKKNL